MAEEKIYSQSEMDAVRKRYMENTLSAVRITVAAMRSQADPNFRSDEFPLFGRMRQQTPHAKQLDELLARAFIAEQRAKALEDQARATSAPTPSTTTAEIAAAVERGDAVALASAREIIEAGRKRRGGT